MQPRETIVNQVRAALERDAHIDPANFPVDVLVEGDALTLSGEVPSIASKRVAVSAVSHWIAAAASGSPSQGPRLSTSSSRAKGSWLSERTRRSAPTRLPGTRTGCMARPRPPAT